MRKNPGFLKRLSLAIPDEIAILHKLNFMTELSDGKCI